MAKVLLLRTPNGFAPADDEAIEKVRRFKTGSLVQLDLHEFRNYEFHKKFFAMLNMGFEHWEPPESEYNGLPAQKNFNRFRKDVTIAAGFYDVVINLRGETRVEAKSISFANMSEDEFGSLYNAAADVLLQRILRNYTKGDLDHVVKQLLDFVNR